MDKPTERPPAPTFSPFAHAIRRPVAVTMVALAVAVFGLVAYSRLPVALMPRFSHPTLTIRTEYPGSAPEEVEQFVTAPLEKALSIVSGLIEVRSLSLAGLSEVVLNFQWGTDLGLALLEVREKLDRLRLPDEVGKPLLLRFDPEESPILRLALLGDFPLTRLRDVAENDLKPVLQTLPGVAFVQIGGGAPPEVTVELDEGRLSRLGLSAGGVAARLAEESINLAGGVLLEGNTEYRVRTLNELASLEEMRDVLVSPRGKPPVRLGDIAQVRLGEGKVSVLARANGLEAVEIEVFKEADANVVATAERVRRLIWGAGPAGKTPKRKPSAEKGRSRRRGEGFGHGGRAGPPRQARPYTDRLEKGMTLSLVADRSRFIEAALGGVRKTAVVGGLLAMAVLYLFLGRLRLTLFVAVAIPLSIVAAFLAMFIAGLTLNMISLGGLALGVGMLVDNAIVVLEAIHRLRERGLAAAEAALEGLREVGGAVTASTLTTVAVFLPLVFVEGIAGQLFNDLALTVVFSLLASLAVALFLLPMLYVTLGRQDGSPGPRAPALAALRLYGRQAGPRLARLARGLWVAPNWLSALLLPYRIARLVLAAAGAVVGLSFYALLGAFRLARRGLSRLDSAAVAPVADRLRARVRSAMDRLTRYYERWLGRLLARRVPVLAAAAGVIALSLFWGAGLERQLIPPLHQGLLRVRLEVAPGTSLQRTAELVAKLERMIRPLPGVANTFARIGEEPDAQSTERGGENVGLVWVKLDAETGLGEAESRLTEKIRAVLADFPEVQHRVEPPALFSLQPPIVVEIQGHSLLALAQTALLTGRRLRTVPEIASVQTHLRPGNPEIRVRFDRQRLARHGLTAKAVAELVRGKLEGESALQFRTGEKKVDVRVRVRRPQLDSIAEMAEMTINPGGATPIPLRAVASLQAARGPSEIRRISQQRVALVTASLAGSDLSGAVEAVERELAALPLPPGVTLAVSGQSREMAQSLRSLLFALLLAIFLVFLVMAAQFESFIQPLLILLSIPLAGIGVVAVLWAVGQPLDVLVGIGLIVLAGIVVNNAIVLVNTINRFQRQGMAVAEAIVSGAVVRLRPILMTTATTVLGLAPLVLDSGAGVEIRRPIALTVIAGLLSAVALTLVVIPCAVRAFAPGGNAAPPQP